MRPVAGNKCHVSFVLTGIVRGSSSRASLVIVMREAQYVMQHALYVCVWLCICVCVCVFEKWRYCCAKKKIKQRKLHNYTALDEF